MKLGAEVLVECLENEDVEYVFGIPGEQTTPVMEELRDSDINFVVTRHEQGAAFMADIYSRVTGEVGVCLSTLGPGATNLVTGIGNASLDHSAVVAITSQRGLGDQHKHSHQFINTNSIFEAITKTTDQIRKAETIPEQVRKSFEIANREKKGSAHLEVPIDVTLEETNANPLDSSKSKVSPNGVQVENIHNAMSILEESENPIIIAGQGIITNRGSDNLEQLVDKTGIPVVTTFMGKGSISARNKKHVGTIGFSTDDYAMDAVKQADTVLTVGYDYIEYHPESWNVGEEKKIIHLDSVPPEIDEHYSVDTTLVGNVSRILNQMTEQAEQVVDGTYADTLRTSYRDKINDEYKESEKPPFPPQQIVRAVREALNDEDILISDVGSHKYWFSRRYPTYDPGTFLVSNGFASMGVALPGSVSASLSSENDVVAVNGDGGFLMNVQELETAKRIGSSQTIIVLDDKEYTAITMEQEKEYNQRYGSSFDNPDFKALAESFGLDGYTVTDQSEIVDTIVEAKNSDTVSVISIPVDPEESYIIEDEMN